MARKTLPLFFLFAISIFIGCGGTAQVRMPQDNPLLPHSTPTPAPVTITASSVMDMSMIGQTWLFTNGYGDICTIAIESPGPVHRNNPDGSMLDVTWTDPNQFVAGRGGNNLVMHETKNNARCWNGLLFDMEVWFPLHQNPDGSWRSTAVLADMPHGCPWCGANGAPTTDHVFFTSDAIDNQPGMAFPYMIAPPTTKTGDHFIFESRVNSTFDLLLTFDNRIPDGTPLTGPTGGEYFRTDFYIENVSTPVYSGPAIVSDQFEGPCGHEKWYFAPGKGIVRIETLTDGGEIKNNPICVNAAPGTHDPLLAIERIN